MTKVNVLGIDFDCKSMREFQTEFKKRLLAHQSTFVVTANPEIVMAAQENLVFKRILQEDADFITADGIGIVKAAQILGHPLPGRVTGYDLFVWLMKLANQEQLRVYLIGAKPVVIHAVQAKLARSYAQIKLVGAEDGYSKEDLTQIASRIAQARPDLVFAALGYPKQEQLLAILRRHNLPALMMGVGGSFDVFSGAVKRAPATMQRLHLEWFYRLVSDPRRFKRMMVLPQFMIKVRQAKRGRK